MHINDKIKENRKHRSHIWMTLWGLLFAFNITLLLSPYFLQTNISIVLKNLCVASMLMIFLCFISLSISNKFEEKYDLAKWKLQSQRQNDKIGYQIAKNAANNKFTTIEKLCVLINKIINFSLIIDNIVIILIFFC